MTNGTIDVALNMDPVWKDDKRRKVIHFFPRDTFSFLYVTDDFKRFRPLAHGVCGMAGLADFNVGEACRAILSGVSVAEITVKIDVLCMEDMVEQNGLIDRNPCENRKDGKEGGFGTNGISVVSHEGKQGNDHKNNQKEYRFFHNRFKIVQNVFEQVSGCQAKNRSSPARYRC